jgi:hypothetical protein
MSDRADKFKTVTRLSLATGRNLVIFFLGHIQWDKMVINIWSREQISIENSSCISYSSSSTQIKETSSLANTWKSWIC